MEIGVILVSGDPSEDRLPPQTRQLTGEIMIPIMQLIVSAQDQVLARYGKARHCHVNRKFADQMTMAVMLHAATVAWRHVSIA